MHLRFRETVEALGENKRASSLSENKHNAIDIDGAQDMAGLDCSKNYGRSNVRISSSNNSSV